MRVRPCPVPPAAPAAPQRSLQRPALRVGSPPDSRQQAHSLLWPSHGPDTVQPTRGSGWRPGAGRAPIASAAAGWLPSAARATTSSSQCPGDTSSPGGPAAPHRRTRASVTCKWGSRLELPAPHARQYHLRARAATERAARPAAAGARACSCMRRTGRPAAPHWSIQTSCLSSPAPPMDLPGTQAARGERRACRTRSANEHTAA